MSSMLQEKTKMNLELQYSVVEMFLDMMAKRDSQMSDHAIRVEKLMDSLVSAVVRSGKYNLTADDGITICVASKIHDLGKLCIKDKYLDDVKNGKASSFEIEAEKKHTSMGADVLSRMSQLSAGGNSFMQYAHNMCRSHHERWDGTGYPDRLTADTIPIEARILSIVNVYDLLRHVEYDGKIMNHQEACMRIKFMKFTYFDPDIVDIFLSIEKEIAGIAQ